MKEEKMAKWEKAPEKKKAMSMEEKAEAIRSSKLPEAQKSAYLQEIGAEPKAEAKGMPFHIYARIKGIDKGRHNAMLMFPKARGISLASLEEWDSIFKDF